MSWENTGQAQISSQFDYFWQSYAPFTLKNNMKFQFPFIISPAVQHIQLKLDIWIRQRNAQAKLKFDHGSRFFAELRPFQFENNMKFSVSFHYLPNSITHSTQIWHMDMSIECAGHDWIWSWFNDFWQSNAPSSLKIIWNLQFLFIISPAQLHIQLQFDWHMDMSKECTCQVMIFGRVITL
jgi:hypothetical protein